MFFTCFFNVFGVAIRRISAVFAFLTTIFHGDAGLEVELMDSRGFGWDLVEFGTKRNSGNHFFRFSRGDGKGLEATKMAENLSIGYEILRGS